MFGIESFGSRGPQISKTSPVADYVASSLANALAKTWVSGSGTPVAGETVYIQGYATPGDGGEGLFNVDDSGDVTDGGTCFVFDEDRVAHSYSDDMGSGVTWHNLPHNGSGQIVWGSFAAIYDAAHADKRITDKDMYYSSNANRTAFDHENARMTTNKTTWRNNLLSKSKNLLYWKNYNFDIGTAGKYWTAGTGCTFDGADAIIDGSQVSTQSLKQAASVTNGVTYNTQFNITVTAGSVTLVVGGTSGTTRSSTGNYSEDIVAGASPAEIDIQYDSDFVGTIKAIEVWPNGYDQWDVEYDYVPDATTLRLKRDLSAGDFVKPEWWGAFAFDETDNTWEIGWAYAIAGRYAVATSREWDVIHTSLYGTAGDVSHHHNTRLKGAADGVRDGQGIKILSGVAAWTNLLEDDFTVPYAWRLWNRWNMSTEKVRIRTEDNFANLLHVVDFDIDGNDSGNQRPITNPEDYDGFESYMQNTGDWYGYFSVSATEKGVGGSLTPEHVLLENVHVHNCMGGGINSQNTTHWTGSNRVKIGNIGRNHNIYQMQVNPSATVATEQGNITGKVVDVDIYDYHWSVAIILYAGHIDGLTYSFANAGPFTENNFFAARNGNATPGVQGNSYWGGDVTFENFNLDFTDSDIEVMAFVERGIGARNVTFKNGVFTTNANNSEFFTQNTVNYLGTFLCDNVVMLNKNSAEGGVVGNITIKYQTHTYTDVIIKHDPSHDTLDHVNAYFRFDFHPDAGAAQTWDITRFHEKYDLDDNLITITRGRIFNNQFTTGATGGTVTCTDCDFNNSADVGCRFTPSAEEKAACTYNLDGCTFNVYTGGNETTYENTWMDWWHFDNCEAVNTGRLSESDSVLEGQASFDFATYGAVSFVDVDINLFWIPSEATTTLDSGASTVIGSAPNEGSVEGTDWDAQQNGVKMLPRLRIHFGRVLESGETLVYDWTAAVRPI